MDRLKRGKKDSIISVIRFIVGVVFLISSYYIFTNGLVIVKPGYEAYNLIAQLFILFLGIFIVFMAIVPLCFPKMRVIQFVFGIFLIFVGYYIFINDPDKNIFIGDLLRVLGAFLVVVGPIGICIPDKCKKQEEEKTVEIIEV